jgi:hypothetical protein
MFDHKDLSDKGDSETAPGSMSIAGITSGMLSGLALSFGGAATKKNKRAPTLKQLKEEFMSEMRYLSKLRHPCVTTVMGALIEKGEEPMLIMGTFVLTPFGSFKVDRSYLYSSFHLCPQNIWTTDLSLISYTTRQW